VSGGIKQGADRLDCVTSLADDSWYVALARRQMKGHPVSGLSPRENNLVGKLNEFADDEAKELLHASAPAQAVTFFRALVMMLPTVCEGRAPTLTQ
jgi:hypothetical protein